MKRDNLLKKKAYMKFLIILSLATSFRWISIKRKKGKLSLKVYCDISCQLKRPTSRGESGSSRMLFSP